MNSKALKLAHKIKDIFSTWSEALKAAWRLVKMQAGIKTAITFAKAGTGEIRKAEVLAIGSLKTLEKGFVRFIEQAGPDKTQWRSFRLETLIFEAA